MNLYAIASEYRAQLAALADLHLPPEVVADTVDGMAGAVEDKLRAVIAYSLELEVQATGAAEAAKRMQDRAKAITGRVEYLRSYALQVMQDIGKVEVFNDEFAAKVMKKPASVHIIHLAMIPPAYMRQAEAPPPEPDKKAIADAIKTGASVPGCELVQGYRLGIK